MTRDQVVRWQSLGIPVWVIRGGREDHWQLALLAGPIRSDRIGAVKYQGEGRWTKRVWIAIKDVRQAARLGDPREPVVLEALKTRTADVALGPARHCITC